MEIAAIDPDFDRGHKPLSLMEYAGRRLNQQNALDGALTGEVSFSPKAITRLKARVKELWTARQNATSGDLRDQWQC